MQRDALNETIYGGLITEYSLDLLQKSFTLKIERLFAGELSHYQIVFLDVSSFEFEDEFVSEWERIEITELHVEKGPEESESEEWCITLNLWDVAEVRLRCGRISVDGESLT